MAGNAMSNEQYRLVGTYERLRKAIMDKGDREHLNRELSYWVLPSDRRLPIAFLDRKLGDLLSQPLEELMSTPGVGQKKIFGFFDLLKRVNRATADESRLELANGGETKKRRGRKSGNTGFDPTVVSEELWSTWRETVARFDVGNEKLGRLAPSLQALPTVIWHTPLSDYLDLTLSQIRRRKTHGEKRVHAILEVFCTIHEALATSTVPDSLDVVLVPHFIPRLNRWLFEMSTETNMPPADEVQEHVIRPLVHQVEIDLGKTVAKLAASRLSLDRAAPTVRQQAKRLNVTRARIYQLLEDCAKVMEVRWPEGNWLLAALATKLESPDTDAVGLVHATCDLFFPNSPALPSSASRPRLVEGTA